MSFESTFVVVVAGNLINGKNPTGADLARLILATNRINRLAEAFK
jgi:hypothetical protein